MLEIGTLGFRQISFRTGVTPRAIITLAGRLEQFPVENAEAYHGASVRADSFVGPTAEAARKRYHRLATDMVSQRSLHRIDQDSRVSRIGFWRRTRKQVSLH